MRTVLQRVKQARVAVDGAEIAAIGPGLLALVGVGHGDTEREARALAAKVANLRIFEDSEGKTNLSLADTRGQILVVSQFTLYADTRKGRRPSFTDAADPAMAEKLVETFRQEIERQGLSAESGKFQAHMEVSLVNDGPFTLVLDTDLLPGSAS